MSDITAQLIDMGFDKERAELAVKKSSNLDGAIDYLDKNAEKSTEELLAAAAAAAAAEEPSSSTGEGMEAKSLKCDDCGKIMRNTAAAEYHATKSGHENFSESIEEVKPLTEEEKKAKLAELREKAAARKKDMEAEDKIAKKKNNAIRAKSNREAQDIKEDLQKKEQIKEAEKKRREKQADIEHKKATLAKIEADKQERKAKAEREKALREGRPVNSPLGGPSTAPAVQPKVTANHNQARLRLMTPGGNIMKTVPAETTLFELAHMLQQDGVQASSFSTTFPKKTFDNTDFGMTLAEAGCVPSAVLNVR